MTTPEVLSLRVDASLYFPSARFIEDLVNDAVAANPAVSHVILECPAVKAIDASALESLEAINHRLKDGGITFHLSEVKGPIMDRLQRSHFLAELTGKVHLTQYDAMSSINPDLARSTQEAQGFSLLQPPFRTLPFVGAPASLPAPKWDANKDVGTLYFAGKDVPALQQCTNGFISAANIWA